MGLVQQDQQGQPTLTCPTCRQVTPVPASGVAGLQADFRANQLLEVMNVSNPLAFIKVEVSQSTSEGVNKKATGSCPEHSGKGMEFFCETCEENICYKCVVKGGKHHNHDYMDLNEALDKYMSSVARSLLKKIHRFNITQQSKQCTHDFYAQEIITVKTLQTLFTQKIHESWINPQTWQHCMSKIQVSLVATEKALTELDARLDLISNQRATIEEEMHNTIKIDDLKTELISQLHQLTQAKIKSLAAQRDQLETMQAQLHRHLHHMREASSELLSSMIKEAKELEISLTPEMLELSIEADLAFLAMIDSDTGEGCVVSGPLPFKCHFRQQSFPFGEKDSVILDTKYNQYCMPSAQLIQSFLKHDKKPSTTECKIEKIGVGEFKVSYQPTIPGAHQLHITVQGQHIMGSPFPITVWTSTEFAKVKNPRGIAVNKRREVMVTSLDDNCITVFSPSGEKLLSFGSRGSGAGQFQAPVGVTVDRNGNIFVSDTWNNSIQKFSEKGRHLATFSGVRSSSIALHASNDKLYVANEDNEQIHILNSDLTSAGIFGNGKGEFRSPGHIACGRDGNVYVTDRNNHCIRVFTADGEFMRMFGKHGKSEGELHWPLSIAVDTRNGVYFGELGNHCVSVFNSEGQYLFSIRTEHLKRPTGLALSDDGALYVCGSPDKVFCVSF